MPPVNWKSFNAPLDKDTGLPSQIFIEAPTDESIVISLEGGEYDAAGIRIHWDEKGEKWVMDDTRIDVLAILPNYDPTTCIGVYEVINPSPDLECNFYIVT